MKKTLFFKAIATFIFLIISSHTYAHVKWFSEYSFNDEPLQLADVTNTIFWVLSVASIIVVGLFTFLDKKIELTAWYRNLSSWLNNYRHKSVLVMRISAAVVLLMSWQLGTLIMPELVTNSGLLMWFQFLLAVLLLFRATVPIAGLGMLIVYFVGIYEFGLFHMLDYLLILGVGYFFITSNSENSKIKNTGLLLIYITVGFSLCWAGFEKLIYPQWGTYLLEKYPQLALGLDVNLFVQGAAFIEISVGVMFIFGYFQRILAVVVTLLFILTSLVFGSKEVTGHLLIHASLIIFFIEGSGNIFETLPGFYRRIGRNPIFAGMGFFILLFAFLVPYTFGANKKYNEAVLVEQSKDHPHNLEISDEQLAPKIEVKFLDDRIEGWNVQIITQNLIFKIPGEKTAIFNNEGYAVMTINGKLIARIYSPFYYLPPMGPGIYNVEVNLFSLNHEQLTHLGLPINARYEIVVE